MIDDVVREILLRLPVKCLVRCKSLSKEWKDYISCNKTFRQMYLKRNCGVSLMFGFHVVKHIAYYLPGRDFPDQVRFLPTSNEGRTRSLLKKRKRDENGDSSLWIDKPLKKTKSEFNRTRAFPLDESLSFLSPNLADIRVLGSSNGFLLCTIDKEWCPMSYLVCNPINKRWFSLPRANISSRLYTHGFTSHSTSPGLDTADYYKVVRAIAPPDCSIEETLTIEIISSDEPEWKRFDLSCPSPFILDNSTPLRIIISDIGEIYIRGRLVKPETQTFDYGVIIFHEESKDLVQWMNFPPAVDYRECKDCFGQSEGNIVYARHEPGQLKVWTLNMNDKSSREWILKHSVSLEIQSTETNPDFVTRPWHSDLCFLGFHPRNMNILFLGIGKTTILCDIESSTIEKICSFPEQGWKLDYYLLPYTYGLMAPHLFLCG
ncbi:hypothetical protein ACHQM5_014771 [Ranunculus cassubicifolius]